jgi:hypothetical protein
MVNQLHFQLVKRKNSHEANNGDNKALAPGSTSDTLQTSLLLLHVSWLKESFNNSISWHSQNVVLPTLIFEGTQKGNTQKGMT